MTNAVYSFSNTMLRFSNAYIPCPPQARTQIRGVSLSGDDIMRMFTKSDACVGNLRLAEHKIANRDVDYSDRFLYLAEETQSVQRQSQLSNSTCRPSLS